MARTTGRAFNGAGILLDDGFRAQLLLAWRLLRDERVSPLKYVLPVLLGIYVASPLDTIPDVLLGLGQLDDLGIVILALMLFVRIMPWFAPPEVVAEHRGGSRREAHGEARRSTTTGEAVEAEFHVRMS